MNGIWLSELDSRLVDDKYFRLLSNLSFYSVKYEVKITAPTGMISDGPSVGRWPILFLLFGKKGKRAAVIHDWLYRNAFFPRDVCDDIYLEALLASGYNWTAKAMYAGVRIGGAPHYGPKGKAGCLDPRTACNFFKNFGKCVSCEDYLASYQLTIANMKPEDLNLC